MNETRIPQISDEMKRRIKNIVKYHYGFTPKDNDLEWIDRMLRNNYATLHDQQIIRELAAKNVSDELLKNRDSIGSIEFERIWHEKSIFKYLTFASMCFRAGIPAGSISLCRTAIESGLRERLAEELAKKETTNVTELPETTWNKLKELNGKMLFKLIKEADQEGIIEKQKIEEIFQEFKFEDQSGMKILDKFIHGDIVWMVNFVRDREEDTSVIGAKDKLQEHKIISNMKTDKIAIEVLKATTKIAEILYYKTI
ncbi:MAG: hypothetical protein ABOK23_07935 [Candidatus Methanoperedens sp.]|nr:hypothetical protein [Candidatus Methanoperedens sp.]MCZ7394828.1 hypothetical protein [Candidatus Methanoperedens sp.]